MRVIAPRLGTGGAEAAIGLVQGRFNDSLDIASLVYDQALSHFEALNSFEYPLPAGWQEPEMFDDIPGGALDGITVVDPAISSSLEELEVSNVGFFGRTPGTIEGTINIGSVPGFNVTQPSFEIPQAPDIVWTEFNDAAPSSLGDALSHIPSTLELTLPPLPGLADIQIPSLPEIDFAQFTEQAPVMDLTPPDTSFSWTEAIYTSDLKQAIESKLLNDIRNGGTGLDEATEQAIYDRARSRQQVENEQLYTEALEFFSSRGFTFPPGALAGRMMEASARIAQINEDLNNDILVQQSKLAQENTHFIITSANEHERMTMDYINNMRQRGFEAAKYMVEAAIVIYRARVEAYKTRMEAYQIQAQVYEARIRAELLKVETYKAQIEGARLGVEVNRAAVEVYIAQVNALQTRVDLYKAQMEGARLRAEIDRIQIEGYAARVEAYQSLVNSKVARINGYTAQIAGEAEKARMYASQVDAYKSEVDAYGVKAEVEIKKLQAQVEEVNAEVEAYKAEVARYDADVRRAIADAEIKAKRNDNLIAQYDADTRKYMAQLDGLTKYFSARVEQNASKHQVEIKKADVMLQTAMGINESIVESLRQTARMFAQLVSSALTSVSASAQVGLHGSTSDSSTNVASDSYSDSYSWSWTVSQVTSTSTVTSTSHNTTSWSFPGGSGSEMY